MTYNYFVQLESRQYNLWRYWIVMFPDVAAQKVLEIIDCDFAKGIAFRLDLDNALMALRKMLRREFLLEEEFAEEFIERLKCRAFQDTRSLFEDF